ncbi:MAG: dethiobiotin synthase [Cyanobacteria bacterium SIG31]|nr:dethiobiotin synthase [Cyanobacteria bacterium SIG31]
MLNIYITSANHKDGKSFLSAGIATTMQSLGYSTSVYKPVQTGGLEINGFMQSPDLTFIKSLDPYINTHFSYLYKTKAEPLIASELENNPISAELIINDYKKISAQSDCTILDADNGIMSPLSVSLQNIDIIKFLQIPILVTVSPSENAINSTLLTINNALEKGIDVRGVVINNIQEDCPKTLLTSITRVIEEYSSVKILGLLPHLNGKISPEDLITAILNGIDIESVFKVKIEKLDFS